MRNAAGQGVMGRKKLFYSIQPMFPSVSAAKSPYLAHVWNPLGGYYETESKQSGKVKDDRAMLFNER
jgi:hypothetical protein